MTQLSRFLAHCGTVSLVIALFGLLLGNALLAAVFAAFAGGLYLGPVSFEKGRMFGVREAVHALLGYGQRPAGVEPYRETQWGDPAVAPGRDPAVPGDYPDGPGGPSKEPAQSLDSLPDLAAWTPARPILDKGDLSLTLGYEVVPTPQPYNRALGRGLAPDATGAGKEIRMKLGAMNHILIGGAPRSGKSVMVRAMMYQALLANFEAEAQYTAFIGGIDLTGITLNPALFEGLPQLFEKIATTKEEADWLLDRIEAEAAWREERFRSVPTLPEKLSEYIEATGHRLPYIVLFVEEYGALSILMGKEWQARFTSLVWRVAKYGFHFVCLSQDLTKATVGAARDAFLTRVWFRDIPAATRQMLGFRDDAGVSQNVPGRGWLKLADRELEFQGLWVPKQKLIDVVQLLKERERD